MSCCCCNTTTPCGTFEEAVNPDLGQCFPYREQTTCEAPTITNTLGEFSARITEDLAFVRVTEDGLSIRVIII